MTLKTLENIDLNKDYSQLSEGTLKLLSELSLTRKMSNNNHIVKAAFMENEIERLKFRGLTLDNILNWS